MWFLLCWCQYRSGRNVQCSCKTILHSSECTMHTAFMYEWMKLENCELYIYRTHIYIGIWNMDRKQTIKHCKREMHQSSKYLYLFAYIFLVVGWTWMKLKRWEKRISAIPCKLKEKRKEEKIFPIFCFVFCFRKKNILKKKLNKFLKNEYEFKCNFISVVHGNEMS